MSSSALPLLSSSPSPPASSSPSLLLALPEELLSACAAWVHVDDVLACALTCTHLHRHFRQRLQLNQHHHARYEVCHDRLPLTVPALLRLAIRHHDAAWHIRSFDSWGLRPGFHKWKTWTSYHWQRDDIDPLWPEPAEDHSHLDASYFTPQDYDDLRSVLSDTLRLTSGELSEWIYAVRAGWDEPLKAILFALAPRLDRLNFIAYDSWQGSEFHDDHPFTFLSQLITRIHGLLALGAKWPPGFASLRKVSVCSTTSLRHPHDTYTAQPSAVAPLFYLPNIRILHFSLLGYIDDPNPGFHLPERSSSVEDLSFYCCEISSDAWQKFLLAPRRLLAFSCESSLSNVDGEVYETLATHHSQSLEHISLDRHLPSVLHLISQCCHLKSLDRLQVGGLLKESVSSHTLPLGSADHAAVSDKNGQAAFAVVELIKLLPTSIETVVFMPDPRGTERRHIVHVKVARAVADLVEDKRFNNVKAMCLHPLAGDLDLTRLASEALKRIEAQGVDTHLPREDGRKMTLPMHRRLHRDTGGDWIESDPRPPEELH